MAYLKKVPPPSIFESSDDEEGIKTEQGRSSLEPESTENEENFKKQLDEELERYWKRKASGVEEEEVAKAPIKKRKVFPPPSLTELSQLPELVKEKVEFISAAHKRDAIQDITVQWYGPPEAFGPMKGIQNVRERLLKEKLQLKIFWSKFTPKETPLRGVIIQGMKADIISAMMVINDWIILTERMEEWKGKEYEGLKILQAKIPNFTIPYEVSSILDLTQRPIKEVKRKKYCMTCWKTEHGKCQYDQNYSKDYSQHQ
ncbi:unnamed protein product [Allacma fusca]|uniref:Uncharacterized protein n=1 Tax=Allacma fusca TaxID=39272 RepID=A0A8J2L2D3_9HEXA|nr:unnamed protein product [Allacma fusca]